MLKYSPQLNELAKALAIAQGAMEAAKKDKNNPAFGKASKYADLASIWDSVREPLSKNGLSVIQLPCMDEQGRVAVATLLMHSSGQWIEATYALAPTKSDPQGFGSAITYMKRYALTGTGVAPEDDDGNAATARNGDVAPLPPLERPKQANGTGTHADPKAAAAQWCETAKRTINTLGKTRDLRQWEDAPVNVQAMLRLKAVDADLWREVSQTIEERYSVLSPLNA
jgi:ERF superfamily.